MKNNDPKYITKLTPQEELEFNAWYNQVAKFKNLNPDPDAKGQDYDYRGFFKGEDKDRIFKENSGAHFTDKYKQPGHPTFSKESMYSDKNTEGGSWSKDKEDKWYFTHSPYTSKHATKTYDYLRGTGETSILNGDTLRYTNNGNLLYNKQK